MKSTMNNPLRRLMALTLAVLLIVGLTGCWKKNQPEETDPSTEPSVSTEPMTQAPTTEAPTTEAPTTEAPAETTEAPEETVPVQTTTMGTVSASKLNIRSAPESGASVVGSYFKDDRIELLEIKDGWGRTVKGWVNMEYIKTDKPVDTDEPEEPKPTEDKKDTTNDDLVSDGKTKALGYGVVNLGSLNVRTGPSTDYDKIGTVGLGDRYAYYQKSGNWVRINKGWISTAYFYLEGNTGEGAGTGKVTGDGLNIRSGPGTGFDSVGSYQKGDTVKILTQINGWGYTSKGWVSMKFVEMEKSETEVTKGKGTVTADSLNIRKSPAKDAEVVGSYKKGDKVEILEVKNGWGKTNKGWVSMDYIKMDATAETTEPETTEPSTDKKYKTGKGTVTASELNIRKSPSKTAKSVGSYKKGDKVTILEVDGSWGKTDKGWISLDYVKMDADTVSKYKTGKGTVTASELNIRESASKTAKVVGAYKKGDKVEILEVKGEWGKTNKGWINLQYVKMS